MSPGDPPVEKTTRFWVFTSCKESSIGRLSVGTASFVSPADSLCFVHGKRGQLFTLNSGNDKLGEVKQLQNHFPIHQQAVESGNQKQIRECPQGDVYVPQTQNPFIC